MVNTADGLSTTWRTGQLNSDGAGRLSDYWGQIQRVGGIVEAINTPFERGKRQKFFPRSPDIKDADFDELTRVLIEKARFNGQRLPDYALRRIEPAQIDLIEGFLTADAKNAAEIVLSDRHIMHSQLKSEDQQHTVLHGKNCYMVLSERPHTDGADVVLSRYSGPETIIYGDGFSPKDPKSAPAVSVENGHVWTHKHSNILGVEFHCEFPFATKNTPSWHAKGPANGKPGLYNIMDLIS